jgi:hypothetical protein
MRAHTITSKARTGAGARTKRTVVPGGILALSLAVALLGATASTASADRVIGTWNCQPLPPGTLPTDDPQIGRCFGGVLDSFDFGYHQLGTSAAQRFGLGVLENDTFNPRIGTSGDYAQTNDCPPTLSAPSGRVQGCFIDVTYTPTSAGTRRGTLTTGPGGPTVALTGSAGIGPSPPPLTLSVRVGGRQAPWRGDFGQRVVLTRKLELVATTSNDSTLFATGAVKETTKLLAADVTTRFKVKLERLKRLRESRSSPMAKVRFAATDEFGQTTSFLLRLLFCTKQWRPDESACWPARSRN